MQADNTNTTEVNINQEWYAMLKPEFKKPYFAGIKAFILQQKVLGKKVYPTGKLIFNAFNLTPFSRVKVVIIGQDPYHGNGQAHGLCFSVPDGIPQPPSLVNIFKEIKTDIGCIAPQSGNLEQWARQGVLMLNASLTVNEGEANSHAKCGWHTFTDAVIKTISEHKTGVVFLLWGKFAQNKEELIDTTKHKVLKAAHPSPLAGGAFFGCKHFSKTNAILAEQHKAPIQWCIA